MKFNLQEFLTNFYEKKFYESNFNLNDKYISRSNATWGSFLHKDNVSHKDKSNCHLKNIIERYFTLNDFTGDILEMGCGRANDLEYFLSKKIPFKSYIASDIGENISLLNKKIVNDKVYFIKADNHNIPFEDSSFDLIYSFGSFHHCKNFKSVLLETKRLLKKGSTLIFYNYKKHKYLKKYFLYIEDIMLYFFSLTNYKFVQFFSYFLSFFVYAIFVLPSKFFKLFSKSIHKSIPFNYCSNLTSVYRALIDRLSSPINLRFSENEIYQFLDSIGFKDINVIEDQTGLTIRCKNK